MNTKTLYRQTSFTNSDFPFSIRQIRTQNGQPDILFHWHTDIEIIMSMKGLLSSISTMNILIVSLVILF